MIDINNQQIGDFTIFGFTKDPDNILKHRLPDHLGITPKTIDFGTAGIFFFYTTYGEVAETEQALAVKLGFLRSLGKSPLSTEQLLRQRIMKPEIIDFSKIRGNALVVCIGKKEPIFSAYKTILGVPQLYYFFSNGEFLCSDRLKCIVKLLDHIELNEDLVPMHFLFRSTPGDLTYYRHIKRMLPGALLKWADGHLSVKLVQDFDFTGGRYSINHGDQPALEMLHESLNCVVSDYKTQVETSGQCLATLLSGGVDSSLVQFLINQQTSHSPLRSYSFAVRVPSFTHEIEYAEQASQLLHTEHTFVEFLPEDFPGLLIRAIEALAQPPILETEPSMLAIAEFAQANDLGGRYFVSGQGADTVFGLNWSKKLKGIFEISKIPGSARILDVSGNILKPFKSVSQMLLKGSEILASAKNLDAFVSPTNSIVVYCDLKLAQRCFGDEVIRKALQYRREFAAQYLHTNHYLEQVHVIDLMTDTYELGVQRQQLFLAHHREKIHPYFDDDVLRAGFAFHPDVRYIKGLRPKYLLKDLLAEKTGAPVARKPKGFSIFESDLLAWMQSGPLKQMVQDIRLPGYMSKDDYDRLLAKPNYSSWILLILDIFQRSYLTRDG